ncbi:hypothetical protein M413DRAFT_449753 [Hebeloma cylindrosporum]|uniref:Uncharacterized protein n=1 Tax=Hebeloma cylindrosporum TaxID=76867 RepID=A0A0C2Y2Z4_HEBCY|nr:hypothetical protein M413DRAFT_449753 [Hebeloma cylindrosporum h7]
MTSISRRDSIPPSHHCPRRQTGSSSLCSTVSHASTRVGENPSKKSLFRGRSRAERSRSLETVQITNDSYDAEHRKGEKEFSGMFPGLTICVDWLHRP